MSLFSDLTAAAMGSAPALAPRPRMMFEDGPPIVEVEEVVAADALHAPATPGREASFATPVRPPSGLPPNAAATLPCAAPPLFPAEAVEPRRSDPPDPGRPAGPLVRSADQAIPDGALLGRDPKSRQERQADAPASQAPLVSALPLLPKEREPQATTQAPAARKAAAVPVADDGPPSVSLTIGRIEVRPPSAPGSRTSTTPPARSVIVKRAPVRQSLDDYRSRPRR